MSAYYNDNEPFVAAWLRNLIAAGHLPPGDVDERPIQEVQPDDLRPYRQAHFFAGIGGWPYALRLAGWPDDRPLWTGSCPCQPFSFAGRRRGADDARHLWPEWFRLIRECRPPACFGEQVASADGRTWLAAVRADLESVGYAVGAADLPACGVGAPHRRQRLWFVADAGIGAGQWDAGCVLAAEARQCGADGSEHGDCAVGPPDGRAARLMADTERAGRPEGRTGTGDGPAPGSGGDLMVHPLSAGLEGHAGDVGDGHESGRDGAEPDGPAAPTGAPCDMGDTDEPGREARDGFAVGGETRSERAAESGAWADLLWLPCRDGKWRPTQPGLFPLAHGVSGRVGRLRALGNAIVPQVAAEVVKAYLDTANPDGLTEAE